MDRPSPSMIVFLKGRTCNFLLDFFFQRFHGYSNNLTKGYVYFHFFRRNDPAVAAVAAVLPVRGRNGQRAARRGGGVHPARSPPNVQRDPGPGRERNPGAGPGQFGLTSSIEHFLNSSTAQTKFKLKKENATETH